MSLWLALCLRQWLAPLATLGTSAFESLGSHSIAGDVCAAWRACQLAFIALAMCARPVALLDGASFIPHESANINAAWLADALVIPTSSAIPSSVRPTRSGRREATTTAKRKAAVRSGTGSSFPLPLCLVKQYVNTRASNSAATAWASGAVSRISPASDSTSFQAKSTTGTGSPGATNPECAASAKCGVSNVTSARWAVPLTPTRCDFSKAARQRGQTPASSFNAPRSQAGQTIVPLVCTSLMAGRQIVAGFKGRTGKGRRFALPAESALATAHNQPNAAFAVLARVSFFGKLSDAVADNFLCPLPLCVRLAGEFNRDTLHAVCHQRGQNAFEVCLPSVGQWRLGGWFHLHLCTFETVFWLKWLRVVCI